MNDGHVMPQYDGMEYEELVAAAQFLWMENAELKKAMDFQALELGCMTDNRDVLHVENTKLRELVLDMFEEIEDSDFDPLVERQGKRGPYYEEDPFWRVGIRERVRELGIEVEE